MTQADYAKLLQVELFVLGGRSVFLAQLQCGVVVEVSVRDGHMLTEIVFVPEKVEQVWVNI